MDRIDYINKLTEFSRTIEVKSDLKKTVLINRIRESLRSEYQAVDKIDSLEMTAEIGHAVLSLLKKVFIKLEREGIRYDKACP